MSKGKLSINAENIFPIIKKWLYSEHDIFLREIISNSNDAIRKHEKLVNLGEAKALDENYKITINLSKKNKIIEVIDNGIGMSEDEVNKYINEIAFSGAVDFMNKYKDKADDKQIIGHFGLGFYSSFMVSDLVEIETKSFKEDEKAVHWISNGDTEYEMKPSDKETVGTKITLHLDKESEDFLEEYKVRELIRKYFSFLQVEIYFNNLDEEKKETEDKKDDDNKEDEEETKPTPINDTNPLWLKKPSEVTDEEYKAFYKKVFMDFNDPLFWVHINMDYPFHLKGILYFPKLKHEFETLEGQVKLYYNQVFVADNIKEIIPEFLLLLKGTIDCPDLPLNVSRSFLQSDTYVKKISSHITKKVSKSLKDLYNKKREDYNKYWDDINPFVKYGCLRDDKFFDNIKSALVFKTINDEYKTTEEMFEDTDKENTLYYVSDVNIQSQYINMFKEIEKEAVILNTMIDPHFISYLEMKNPKVKFKRIDSDISDDMMNTDGQVENNEETEKKLTELFKELKNDDTLTIKLQNLKVKDTSAIMTISEESRRMEDMQKMYGGMMGGMSMPQQKTLVMNQSSSLVSTLINLIDNKDRKDDVDLVANHIYDLAKMSQKPLTSEEMTNFIKRSNQILEKLVV